MGAPPKLDELLPPAPNVKGAAAEAKGLCPNVKVLFAAGRDPEDAEFIVEAAVLALNEKPSEPPAPVCAVLTAETEPNPDADWLPVEPSGTAMGPEPDPVPKLKTGGAEMALGPSVADATEAVEEEPNEKLGARGLSTKTFAGALAGVPKENKGACCLSAPGRGRALPPNPKSGTAATVATVGLLSSVASPFQSSADAATKERGADPKRNDGAWVSSAAAAGAKSNLKDDALAVASTCAAAAGTAAVELFASSRTVMRCVGGSFLSSAVPFDAPNVNAGTADAGTAAASDGDAAAAIAVGTAGLSATATAIGSEFVTGPNGAPATNESGGSGTGETWF